MKKLKPIATTSDLLALSLVVVFFIFSPVSPYHQRPTGIPDKVEVYYQRNLPKDSLKKSLQYVENEIVEMEYYLHIHNVNDEGYNLVAEYDTKLRKEHQQLLDMVRDSSNNDKPKVLKTVYIKSKDRPGIAVLTAGGYWQSGRFHIGPFKSGKTISRDRTGRIVSALWNNDTIVTGIRIDSNGIYQGQMDSLMQACGEGVMDEWDGCHKEGFWRNDMQHGFGFDSSPQHQLRIGEWREGRFLGERMKYTAQRIYGIDISRHQHEKGRQRFAINWRKLRITSFGKRNDIGSQTFPVSFVYIKATEGITIRNRYFLSDYLHAHRHGLKVGAYHFFSVRTPAIEQAQHFLRTAKIHHADLPPVLDVEPTDAQIQQIGGGEVLLQRIRIWMNIVERRTGKTPILYANQNFIIKYLKNAADIKKKYNIWIARYSQYKPDVKLVYWQLCQDGRVNGINGPVDINVFNGYQGQYEEFLRTGVHQ